MATLKWIGLLVRMRAGEIRTLTVEAPSGERQALYRSVARHVAELARDEWCLVYETYITVEDGRR